MSRHLDEERRTAIIRLLETRDDHLPSEPRNVSPVAAAGFVHTTLAPTVCPICEGVSSFSCTGCGGRGEVEELREQDPYAKNEKILPFGFDRSKHDQTSERDRKIEALTDQTRPPRSEAQLLEEANRRGYAWEEARRTMYQRFDYGALDLALDWLRSQHDDAYHALHAVYVYQWLIDLSPSAEVALEHGLTLLHQRLPDPLRAPGNASHPAADRQRRRLAS